MGKTHPKKSIFLADDDAHILETAKDILEASDYEVRTAEKGAEALDALRQRPADLLIVDFNLIDTTGADLALQAKAICPAMPIILMTGEEHADLGDARSVIQAVLIKPVNPLELLTLIQKTI